MIFTPGAMIIGGAVFLISLIVSQTLKAKFKKYSKTPVSNGLSGREVAEKMLHENGIFDVQIISTPGKLTDHYNPKNRTVNLSKEVYEGRNMAAAAVAAHECGHAVQHATSYSMLQLRSSLVPVQNASATVMNLIMWGMIIGSWVIGSMAWQVGLPIIIICYTVFTLFAFVTLPVEFDATNRALAWIQGKRIYENEEYKKAKNALWWASMTYLVAALGSLAMLVYYIMLFLGRRD